MTGLSIRLSQSTEVAFMEPYHQQIVLMSSKTLRSLFPIAMNQLDFCQSFL